VKLSPFELLLVEDNPGDILLIRQILLEEPFPVRVHVALDGEQALQMLVEKQFEPDLVILDLNLPRVSGLSLLARCRFERPIPIVVFSSSSSPDGERRSLELGAREFVQKPSDLQEFARRVAHIVRDWVDREGGASALSVGFA